jgi:hypothetical protein
MHVAPLLGLLVGVLCLPLGPASAKRVLPQPPPISAAPAKLARCVGRPVPSVRREKFRHKRSRVMARASGAAHALVDVVTAPERAFEVVVKTAYGRASKDLEDERVRLYVDDCQDWLELTSAPLLTDDDGMARARAPGLSPGVHELLAIVPGDGTMARARVFVLPPGTHVVVSDVDGTLTTSDSELVEDLFAVAMGRRAPPDATPGGQALTHAHRDRGDVVIYLTGRPTVLLPMTRDWLFGGGFASGPVLGAPTMSDAAPTDDGVGAFKTRVLGDLLALGLVVDAVYGNATTDILAYGKAGIARAVTFIVGPHAGKDGTIGVPDWRQRARAVAGTPAIAQPFSGWEGATGP